MYSLVMDGLDDKPRQYSNTKLAKILRVWVFLLCWSPSRAPTWCPLGLGRSEVPIDVECEAVTGTRHLILANASTASGDALSSCEGRVCNGKYVKCARCACWRICSPCSNKAIVRSQSCSIFTSFCSKTNTLPPSLRSVCRSSEEDWQSSFRSVCRSFAMTQSRIWWICCLCSVRIHRFSALL